MADNSSEALSMLEMRRSLQSFGLIDYTVFSTMLVGCAGIGVYFALRSKPQKGGDEAAEYLMGGRSMSVFPISMSLIASYISGITLLGTPTEVYLHGTEYLFSVLGFIIASWVATWLVIPVFHDLQLSSTYEYLRIRYDKKVQLLGSVFFLIGMTCWLPIVNYVPALAFNQVTGINMYVVPPIVCLVCVFYTCVGGLKAVVWTDVIQSFLMVGGIIVIVVKGTYDVGGINEVLRHNSESSRLEIPSFSLDPTVRHSMISVTLGSAAGFLQDAFINQAMIQRYLTLPTVTHAKIAVLIFITGLSFLVLVCGYTGLLAYATYYDCDPLTTGLAKASDQVLPLLVMRVFTNTPGLPGLFISGVFSAALSSLSTGLNSMAAVMLEDFVKPRRKTPLSDRATMIILRTVVVIYGILCVALVYVVAKLGSVLMLSWSLSAIASGATMGLFVGGMLLPVINAKGALYGGIGGMMLSSIMIFGAQHASATGTLIYANKDTTIEGCNYVPAVLNATVVAASSEAFPLFRVSYQWYTLFGAIVTLILALTISVATGGNSNPNRDTRMYAPVIRRWLPKLQELERDREEKELLNIGRKE